MAEPLAVVGDKGVSPWGEKMASSLGDRKVQITK